jgi:hypothetical protein
VNHNAERNLARLRFALAGLRVQAAEAPFEAGGRKFKRGHVHHRFGRKSRRICASGSKMRRRAWRARSTPWPRLPEVARHPVAAPRIALVHTWLSTQTEGWFRVAGWRKIPYKYFGQYLRDKSDLRSTNLT